ncbi:MAG: hypothetical protein FWD65_05345 [Coriobacteriia bacterium]|nr:hypothetical protein [Coriobacteriia bacterium]
MNVDISHLSNADLTALVLVCGAILVVFVVLLISQRKYLTFFRKKPQYKIDAEKYEQMAVEARQNNAEAREALVQADQALEHLRAASQAEAEGGGVDAAGGADDGPQHHEGR